MTLSDVMWSGLLLGLVVAGALTLLLLIPFLVVRARDLRRYRNPVKSVMEMAIRFNPGDTIETIRTPLIYNRSKSMIEVLSAHGPAVQLRFSGAAEIEARLLNGPSTKPETIKIRLWEFK